MAEAVIAAWPVIGLVTPVPSLFIYPREGESKVNVRNFMPKMGWPGVLKLN